MNYRIRRFPENLVEAYNVIKLVLIVLDQFWMFHSITNMNNKKSIQNCHWRSCFLDVRNKDTGCSIELISGKGHNEHQKENLLQFSTHHSAGFKNKLVV